MKRTKDYQVMDNRGHVYYTNEQIKLVSYEEQEMATTQSEGKKRDNRSGNEIYHSRNNNY